MQGLLIEGVRPQADGGATRLPAHFDVRFDVDSDARADARSAARSAALRSSTRGIRGTHAARAPGAAWLRRLPALAAVGLLIGVGLLARMGPVQAVASAPAAAAPAKLAHGAAH